MFERFTKDAREVVMGAVAHADGGGRRQAVEPRSTCCSRCSTGRAAGRPSRWPPSGSTDAAGVRAGGAG